MKDIFMRMSLELLDEDFGSLETKNLCILALVYMSKYAHNVSGELYLSFSSLAKNLGVNKKKAIRIVGKLEEKKYIKNTGKKIKVGKFWLPVYQISLYERQQKDPLINETSSQNGTVSGTVSGTINGTVKSSNDNIQNHIDGTVNGTVNGTVSGTKTNTVYKTNTENKTNTYKEKSESVNEDFEKRKDTEEIPKPDTSLQPVKFKDPDIEEDTGIVRPTHLVTELPREKHVNPKQLEAELQRLIAFYPKKSGNFRRLRDRYRHLRLKKKLRFEEIYEAIDGYMLEMDAQDVEQKYWKTLDTLFDPVELDPWLYKPTISIDKKGQRFKGEFCIATRVIRYHVPEKNRIETQVLPERKVDQMIEEGRLIFLDKDNIKQEVKEVCHAS